MSNTRLKPKDRRDSIMDAALIVARRDGYRRVTRDKIAEQASCSVGLVTHYFSTMAQLRRAVMRAAVAEGHMGILAEGLAVGDPHAKKAPDAMKRRALASLA